MFDPVTALIAVLAFKGGQYVADKKAKEAKEREAKAPPHYHNEGSPPVAAPPRHMSPEQRSMFVEGSPSAFVRRFAAGLERRLAQHAFDPVLVNGVTSETVGTFRLAPLAAGRPSGLDVVHAAWKLGGEASLSLSCVLPDGERLVVVSRGPMPKPVLLSPHFARLPQTVFAAPTPAPEAKVEVKAEVLPAQASGTHVNGAAVDHEAVMSELSRTGKDAVPGA